MLRSKLPVGGHGRLAYCSCCRGVLPFEAVRRRAALPRLGFACRRCGTLHREVDPGAAGRRRSIRYLAYAIALGLLPASVGLAALLLAPGHPLIATRTLLGAAIASAMGLGCLARSMRLGLQASRFESLTAWEVEDLARRLCPGMIRSDVIDELARCGWRIGKIRSVLSALVPASRAAA